MADAVVGSKRAAEVEITRKKGKKGGRRSNQTQDSVEAREADYVRIVPAGAAADEALGPVVQLSAKSKAPGLELGPDRLSVTGCKGFRSVRATHGFHEGTFYCEVTLRHLGASGHCRLGWGTKAAELSAPVGYDKHGFGYRDVDGSKVHAALREPYARPFAEGDVVGLLLHLPPGGRPLESRVGSDLVRFKGALWREQPAAAEEARPLPGSLAAFSVNGVMQGPAFRGLPEGTYYPMLSLFTLPQQGEGATLAVNFGPAFAHPPPRVEGCPPAQPLSALPDMLRAEAEADEAAALTGAARAAAPAAAPAVAPAAAAAAVAEPAAASEAAASAVTPSAAPVAEEAPALAAAAAVAPAVAAAAAAAPVMALVAAEPAGAPAAVAEPAAAPPAATPVAAEPAAAPPGEPGAV